MRHKPLRGSPSVNNFICGSHVNSQHAFPRCRLFDDRDLTILENRATQQSGKVLRSRHHTGNGTGGLGCRFVAVLATPSSLLLRMALNLKQKPSR